MLLLNSSLCQDAIPGDNKSLEVDTCDLSSGSYLCVAASSSWLVSVVLVACIQY